MIVGLQQYTRGLCLANLVWPDLVDCSINARLISPDNIRFTAQGLFHSCHSRLVIGVHHGYGDPAGLLADGNGVIEACDCSRQALGECRLDLNITDNSVELFGIL
jgi:hypothetical protein